MKSLRTTEHSRQRVRHCQVVVVVGVEVEVGVGITLDHLAEVLDTLQGIHDAQRVGQHKATDADVTECVHQLIDIQRRVLHAVRPVFEIEVHGEPFLTGIFHLTDDVVDMFLGGLLQLSHTMAQRAFRQEVDGLRATACHPVDTLSAIHESEDLHTVEFVDLLCVAADHADGLLLPFRDTCRRHLDAVHIEVAQQHAGDHELLVRQETHTVGLLTVAQRGVHDFHKRTDALVLSYLFCCSHCSVLFWFSTRKSISSKPFIRQCFL